MYNRILSLTLIIILIIFSYSCVPYKELRYFNDIENLDTPVDNPRKQKKINKFDNLYIRILSTDEKTSNIFNNSSDQSRYMTSANLISYTVDEEGFLNFPFVGKINVLELTLAEAGEKIQKSLSEYISNTAVIVKYVDNKVTVLGEVQRQGVMAFTEDKISIYDAISLAGGMTRFGNHKKVVLIRQVDNKISHYRLDLSNSKISADDKYYILPNDIIVVEPLQAVSWSYQNMTYTTILSTITTLIAILYFVKI